MAPRNYRTTSRRSRMPGLLLGGAGLVALLAIGIVGTLWILGVPLNPFASREPEPDPFMVRIPINAQPIPAYSRVERLHMLNPAGGGLMYQRVPPEATIGMSIVGVDQNGSHVESRVESVNNVDDEVVFVVTGGNEVHHANAFTLGGAIMNVNAIIGRVVKADKRAGLGFSESTFFPQGTPEGLAGATPPGMRAITLDATRLTGVHSLNAGDRIDLLASVPVEVGDGEGPEVESEVNLLAQNATVLRPVYVRNEVTQSSSLMSGKTMQNVPKYEVALAVSADDVIPLQNALNQSLPITCVAHSMKPEGSTEPLLAVGSPDEVRVPVTVRPILAYQVVSRDAFVSPATRVLKTETISRQLADRLGVITSVQDALGAITRQDIPAGRYLRHTDLLKGPPDEPQEAAADPQPRGEWSPWTPGGQRFVVMQNPAAPPSAPAATAVGDRPAVSSFVPPGMRAFAIPWNDVYGAEHLQIGDTIDLLVSYDLERKSKETIPIQVQNDVVSVERDLLRSRKTARRFEESFGFRGEPWFVATQAKVLGPLGFPAPAPAERAMQEASANRDDNERERIQLRGPPILIAVSELDAENVAAAIVTKEAMFSYSLYATDTQRTGMKRIAIVPGNIPRLERFDEAVYETNRRSVMARYVSLDDPRFIDAITAEDIVFYYGRVLGRSKTRWDSLRDSDFLPVGTEPGLAASLGICKTISVVETRYVEALAAFEEGDRVSIALRNLYRISDRVHYAGPYRERPSTEVVVRDARIVRRELDVVVLELDDSETSVFQAALAYVKGLNPANGAGSRDQDNTSGTDQGSGLEDPRSRRSNQGDINSSIPSLVAIARPRHSGLESAELKDTHSEGLLTKIPPVDPAGNLHFLQMIIAGNRSTWAFDRE